MYFMLRWMNALWFPNGTAYISATPLSEFIQKHKEGVKPCCGAVGPTLTHVISKVTSSSVPLGPSATTEGGSWVTKDHDFPSVVVKQYENHDATKWGLHFSWAFATFWSSSL